MSGDRWAAACGFIQRTRAGRLKSGCCPFCRNVTTKIAPMYARIDAAMMNSSTCRSVMRNRATAIASPGRYGSGEFRARREIDRGDSRIERHAHDFDNRVIRHLAVRFDDELWVPGFACGFPQRPRQVTQADRLRVEKQQVITRHGHDESLK